MKFLALSLLFVGAAANQTLFNADLNNEWEKFKKAFGKKYADEHEEIDRKTIFQERLAKIIEHNHRGDMVPFRLGINEYSDLSHEEFVKHFNGLKQSLGPKNNGSIFLDPLNAGFPAQVDWRKYGLVTPVKNQKRCGSCWAFSATGALEGQHKRKKGKLVSLSEQNLLDCSHDQGNNGCEGGLMENAFEYIKENEGVDTEQSYPYTAKDGNSCLFQTSDIGATCTGYVDIPSGDEEDLLKAVATVGPVSIAIDAGHESFQSYASGIYYEPNCSSEELNHGVLVVGYGSEDGNDYWLVKNSWGTTWGMEGYIKMTRNFDNQCGIATQATFPLV